LLRPRAGSLHCAQQIVEAFAAGQGIYALQMSLEYSQRLPIDRNGSHVFSIWHRASLLLPPPPGNAAVSLKVAKFL
jgi:hypothetical protein